MGKKTKKIIIDMGRHENENENILKQFAVQEIFWAIKHYYLAELFAIE